MKSNKIRIMLVGSGSGGPVAPVLAVARKIRQEHPGAAFVLVGTEHGPARAMAAEAGIDFAAIPAGKLRRYFSWQNFAAPVQVVAGFLRALGLIRRFKPDVVFGAGGYACVPVMFAAFCLRKKIVIHQQDVVPTLTNKILAPFADKITVSFEQSLKDFLTESGLTGFGRSHKVVWTGNPFDETMLVEPGREDLLRLRRQYGLDEEIPVLLIFGGGTGAAGLNALILEALPDLTRFAYVFHGTGAGKRINFEHPRYIQYELIPNIAEKYAMADLVVCRAGLSTITELSILKKVSIVIPMPDSHQIENALMLKYSDAALVLNQDYLNAEELVSIIRKLMYDIELQNSLRQNIGKIMPRGATHKIAQIILELCPK